MRINKHNPNADVKRGRHEYVLLKSRLIKELARALSRLSSRAWKTPTAFSTFIPSKVIVANGSMFEKGESLRFSLSLFSSCAFLSPLSCRDPCEQFPLYLATWAMTSHNEGGEGKGEREKDILNNIWENHERNKIMICFHFLHTLWPDIYFHVARASNKRYFWDNLRKLVRDMRNTRDRFRETRTAANARIRIRWVTSCEKSTVKKKTVKNRS